MRITFCCANTKPEPWISGLNAALPDAEVSVWVPGAAQADIAIVWAPPQQFIDEQCASQSAQAGLRCMFNIGAGVDALLKLKLPPNLMLVRLDDAGMAVQMAEYVCHAVIRHFRELDRYECDIKAGQWTFRKPLDRADFRIGVLGLGVLGTRVAQALHMFEFPVQGYSRVAKAIPGIRCFAGAAELPEFLQSSRVLVNLLPLTPETENILNYRLLSQLQAGAYLINVARGAHLVDADLLRLIEQGQIAGATLDVFRSEPLPAEHPFWQQPKITLTPHTSARTLRDQSIAQIVRKIKALARGDAVAGLVEIARGY
jgi:glyoxylate/hydroxypyruvate reductase